MITPQPKDRLSKMIDVKKHAFFATIDWKKLERKELKPPFQPKLSNEFDLRYISNVRAYLQAHLLALTAASPLPSLPPLRSS